MSGVVGAFTLLVSLFLLPAAAGASAQPSESLAVTGVVRDASGAALPGATVTIAREDRPADRTVTVTDAGGRYERRGLTEGTYTVDVALAGFQAVTLSVHVPRDNAPLDVVLQVAGLAESVTVLGERAGRSLKDTAASVVVLGSGELEQRPLLVGSTDLMARIPNVTTSGTNNFAPAVRGADGTGPAQGADAFFAGTRPRFNVQVDGRPASYNEVVFGDVGLWDVQQVEVFRGAQSTLQGRNAVAGTLVIKTNDPSYRPEMKLRVGAGSLDTRQIAAMVSGPLVADRVAARLAVSRSTSETFVEDFTTYPGVERPGEFETLTVRGKVLIEPDAAKRFSHLVTVNHAVAKRPQSEGVTFPFDEHRASFPAAPVFEPRSTSLGIESRWTPRAQIGYEQTLALTDVRIERKARPGDGNAVIDGRELVFEPRVRFSSSDARVKGFGGVYVFRAHQDEAIDLFGGGIFDDKTTTLAAFGEATIAVPKNVEITAGLRLEREHRRRSGTDGPFSIDFDATYRVASPKLAVAWHASRAVTVGAVVSRGYNGGAAGFTRERPFVSYTFRPEFVWNYETYARADLLDDRLSLTGNLFLSRYKDMQLPFDLNPDPTVWSFIVRNADAARTFGGEVGATWKPTPELELFANIGLLQTEITEFPDSSVEGHELPQAPAFTSDAGVIYRHSSGVDVSFDTRFSDAYYSSVTNDPRGRTDPYAIANAQAGYSFAGARIFLFLTNLFDSAAPTFIDPGETFASGTAMIIRPRRAGVGVTWGF